MIYLIGGPPRCGKTTLAKKLSEKLKVTWIPTDYIEGVVEPYVSVKDYPKYYPKNVLRDKTENSNDLMYTKYSSAEIIDAYRNQGKGTQSAISSLIELMAFTYQDIIFEGHHITPEFAALIAKKYYKTSIRSVFLVKSDAKEALSSISASTDPDDWVHKKTENKEILGKVAEFIADFSKYYMTEADKYNLNYIDYAGSLEGQLNEAIAIICE